MIEKENLQDLYPLSPMQEGMLFHYLMAPDTAAYVEQMEYGLRGDLDVETFKWVWERLVERHAILRTVFVHDKVKRPLQAVLKRTSLAFVTHDLAGQDAAEQARGIAEARREEAARRFDLTRDVLSRLTVFVLGNQRFHVLWTFHHILLDGWSTAVMMGEVTELYMAARAGRSHRLAPVVPYSRYIAWLEKQDREGALAFWRERLDAAATQTRFPALGGALSAMPTYAEWVEEWPAATIIALDAAARARQVTLNSLLQAAWGLLLQRYSGSRDVIFGTVVSGRPADLAGVEQWVGLFINAVPVRLRTEPGETVATLVARVQADWTACQAYQYLPLADVQGGRNLVHHLLVLESYPEARASDALGAALPWVVETARADERTHYDLTLVVAPGAHPRVTVLYRADRYAEDYVRQIVGDFSAMLHLIGTSPDAQIDALSLPSSRPPSPPSSPLQGPSKTIPAAFEKMVLRHADRPALRQAGVSLSYGEVNRRANRLAHQLLEAGVSPEDVVGVCLQRTPEQLVAILAIVKAGAAYLCVDPAWPQARRAYLLSDASVRVLITDEDGSQGAYRLLHPATSLAGAWSEENPRLSVSPENLAYIAYTSGSTGEPKGVAVRHAGVSRLVCEAEFFAVSPDDVFLHFAPMSFDASTFEVWGAWLNGASVVLPPSGPQDLEGVARTILDGSVTIAWLTAGLFHAMMDEQASALRGLRQLLAGGDVLLPSQCRAALATMDEGVLINGYGPTENTTFTCCHRMAVAADVADPVSIGVPIRGTSVHVLDPDLRPVPPGVAGELYAGGAGLARGYLNRPGATAEAFIPDPFAVEPGARLYRTGDRVRWLRNGTLEFLSRLDDQVKILGHRVEPNEVAAVLRSCAQVDQVAILVDRGDAAVKVLRAFVTPATPVDAGARSAWISQLRSELAALVPAYMIPTHITQLEALPLSATGKVDRVALSAVAAETARGARVAPRNDTERCIAAVWAEILKVDDVGVTDNFFDLGGHSLKATRIMSQLRKRLDVDLPLKVLFENPTVGGLAREALARPRRAPGTATEPALIRRDRSAYARPVPADETLRADRSE